MTPASTTFGSQPVSTSSATQTITLTNTGTGSLTYASTTVSGANPGDFSVGDSNCSSTVFVRAERHLHHHGPVRADRDRHRSATIIVHDNAPQRRRRP